jgi:O-antigen/teichoic acid export membrane protein
MSYLRLLKNIASGFTVRGINIITTILTVPMAVRGLGATDYGILAAVLSASVIFTYADLGLGLTIVNHLTKSTTTADENSRAISRVFYLLILISAATILISLLIFTGVQLLEHSSSRSGNNLAWLTAILCISASVPTGLVQRILFTYQRGAIAGAWMASGKILSLAGVAFCFKTHASVSSYVFMILGVPAIINWLSAFWLFNFAYRALRPRIELFEFGRILPDILVGGQFLILQLGAYAETGIDNLLISIFKTSAAVTTYDLPSRLFSYIPALLGIMVLPLWPALREARLRNDQAWFNRTSALAVGGTLVISVAAGLVLLGLSTSLISIWAKLRIVNVPLMWSLVFLNAMASTSMVQSTILNSQDRISEQAKIQFIGIIVILVAKVTALIFFPIYAIAIASAIIIAARILYLWREQFEKINLASARIAGQGGDNV